MTKLKINLQTLLIPFNIQKKLKLRKFQQKRYREEESKILQFRKWKS